MPKLEKSELAELLTVVNGVWFLVATAGTYIRGNGPQIVDAQKAAVKVTDALEEILEDLVND